MKYLGSYFTAEEAHSAYMYAKANYHKFSARIDDIDTFNKSERFVPRYDIDGEVDYLCPCGETDSTKFYGYHSRSRCKKCTFKAQLDRKRKKKSNKYRFKDGVLYEHLCGHCGETDSTKFYSYTSKATCIPCYNKKQAEFRKKKRENIKNGVLLVGI